MSDGSADGRRDNLAVVPYDESSCEAHVQFATKMWPSKRRRRDPRYNRWKFRGPTEGAVDGLLLAITNGEVVGQLGLIPASVCIDGERVKCQWACDLMVDSSQRRRGIASLLFEAALARGLVTLGSNPSPAADVTMQRIGFRALEGPAIGVFPLDPRHILSWKIPSLFWVAVPVVGAAVWPIVWWRGRELYLGARGGDETVTKGSWSLVAGLVAEQQARTTEPLIVHDEAFLAWRCEGLPGFVEPLGALRTGDGSYAIVGLGAPYFYVFDWWAASWESVRKLFSAIRVMARQAHAKTIRAHAQDREEEGWLRRMGFLFFRQRCKILCLPAARFLPRWSRMRYSIFDSDGNL